MASKHLTERDAALIKARLLNGEIQHEIAAELGVNQGRISEIRTGKKFANVAPAANDNEGDNPNG
jgi:transcriptional regulator with XRE-family HTH domain